MTVYYTHFSAQVASGICVWTSIKTVPHIERIFLANSTNACIEKLHRSFPFAREKSHLELRPVMKAFEHYGSTDAELYLSGVALSFAKCSKMQKKVYRLEQIIPLGKLTTYGRLAGKVGYLHGARAVGKMQVQNPWPLLIPCHRVICSNGRLGGYQCGTVIKRRLLRLEGIKVYQKKSIWYVEDFEKYLYDF